MGDKLAGYKGEKTMFKLIKRIKQERRERAAAEARIYAALHNTGFLERI